MTDNEPSNNPLTNNRTSPQMIVLNQLLQATSVMRHIDELMTWLTNLMVYRLEARIAQIWTMQNNQHAPPSLELRGAAYQDGTFPQNIVANAQVASIALGFITEKRSSLSQPVDTIFPQYLSLMLKRYGVNSLMSSFYDSPFLLPPPTTADRSTKLLTPLNMTMMLFFRQAPSQELKSFIDFVNRQAIQIAKNRELLLPAFTSASSLQSLTSNSAYQQAPVPFSELIPRRLQDGASNPLGGVRLPDKQSRRLYALIDGRRSIGALSETAQLELKTVVTLLQAFVTLRYIQVYEPGGQPVDDNVFLSYH